VSAWSLTEGRHELLPAPYCFLRFPTDPHHDYCRADSNGCASGNCIEEAFVQGFLELVERDAVAMWWHTRASRPEVPIGAFNDVRLMSIARRLRRDGRSVHLLDLTTDLGLPVYVASSWDASGSSILFGMGAHFEARIAATRALTELVQVLDLPTRKDNIHPEGREWLLRAAVHTHGFVVPSGVSEPADFRDLNPYSDEMNAATVIEQCISICARADLDVLLVNLTRADVGFPVVRVVVPGLRHFWKRQAPGRLFTVPVSLGWIASELSEEELNPHPFFL
jgi:ribosomal protein S12 methylthiotransferase accessory factor